MAIPTNMQYFNELLGEQLGGGGGGSSDFSTAQVTVTRAPHTVLYVPTMMDMDEEGFSSCAIMESGTYSVILYKGTSVGFAAYSGGDDNPPQVSIEVISGDAEVSDGEVIITGDCTITVTA